MFPHMYKVRPPRSQQSQAPPPSTGMTSPECEWQGDAWKKRTRTPPQPPLPSQEHEEIGVVNTEPLEGQQSLEVDGQEPQDPPVKKSPSPTQPSWVTDDALTKATNQSLEVRNIDTVPSISSSVNPEESWGTPSENWHHSSSGPQLTPKRDTASPMWCEMVEEEESDACIFPIDGDSNAEEVPQKNAVEINSPELSSSLTPSQIASSYDYINPSLSQLHLSNLLPQSVSQHMDLTQQKASSIPNSTGTTPALLITNINSNSTSDTIPVSPARQKSSSPSPDLKTLNTFNLSAIYLQLATNTNDLNPSPILINSSLSPTKNQEEDFSANSAGQTKAQEHEVEDIHHISKNMEPTIEFDDWDTGCPYDGMAENEENGENDETEEVDEELMQLQNATELWLQGQNSVSKMPLQRAWSPGSPIFKKDIIENKLSRESSPIENWWDNEKKEEPESNVNAWNDEYEDDYYGKTSKAKEPKLPPKQQQQQHNQQTHKKVNEKQQPPTIKPESSKSPKEEDQAIILTTVAPPDAPTPPSSAIPVAPPMPGMPPDAPPPPPLSKEQLEAKEARRKNLDSIRKATRTRPDWRTVMKDLEGGVKLRHVSVLQKADRSVPILPKSRGKNGQFVYESEKPNIHNEMLREIHRGVRLRRTKTNDRSRPDFSKLGLRKLRRQLTKDEQITVVPDTLEALPSSSDEEEDIDTMRDDLQSTKTQLSDEIKKSKKYERELKIKKIDIESLTAEVKKLKRQLKEAGVVEPKPMVNGEADQLVPKLSKSMSRLRMREEDMDFSELDTIEQEIDTLKGQIQAQRKLAEDANMRVEEAAQKLKLSENSADEWELRSVYFEKKYKALQREQAIELPDINCIGTQTDEVELAPPPGEKQTDDGLLSSSAKRSISRKSFGSLFGRMESFKEEDESMDEESSSSSSSEEEEEEEEDEMHEFSEDDAEDKDEEANAERRAINESRRKERDLKLWQSKASHMAEKETNVRRERNNLRSSIKKYFVDMKGKRQEYIKTKEELDELAVQLKEPVEEEEEEEEEEDEEELPPESEDGGGWWFDEPKLKPKKLKKKKKKFLNADGELEDDEYDDDEDLDDLQDLEEPEWSESEQEQTEDDKNDNEEDFEYKITRLQDLTKKHELKMNSMKKENYMLKAQLERCDEMYSEERRRHERLQNELHMILAEL